MDSYEFRIFPPARPYIPPDGAAVFVNLKSDKSTGLGTIAPKNEGADCVDSACVNACDVFCPEGGHTADFQASNEASAPLVMDADVDSNSPRLPPGVALEGRRLVQYAAGGSAYVRPARFTPVRSMACTRPC